VYQLSIYVQRETYCIKYIIALITVVSLLAEIITRHRVVQQRFDWFRNVIKIPDIKCIFAVSNLIIN